MTRVVVDTSALMSILLGEPDAERFEYALFELGWEPSISAATVLESMMVAESRRPDEGLRDLRALIVDLGIVVEPVTEEVTELAFRAWKQFGRGRHPASLNFGDCFSYALAVHLDARLLYKGDDFARTDVRSALP